MSFLSEATKRVGIQRLLSVGASHPTAFFAMGVAGMVTSTVFACRATLKLEKTIEPFMPEVYEGIEFGSRRKTQAAVAVAKLYAPAFVVGAASITMLSKSHHTLVKRNAAITAAYTALDKGFRDYRLRVAEKYGIEEDDLLRYGHETETVKKGQKTEKIDRANPETGSSIYAVWFDQMNPNWSKDPEINRIYLRSMQNYLNDLLHARGHLFLNEVYAELGFEHSQAGSVVGWIMHPDGDNYVDLGVFNDLDPDRVRDFVNGRDASVLLDFNVDGLIWDKIKKHPTHDIKWQATKWFRY